MPKGGSSLSFKSHSLNSERTSCNRCKLVLMRLNEQLRSTPRLREITGDDFAKILSTPISNPDEAEKQWDAIRGSTYEMRTKISAPDARKRLEEIYQIRKSLPLSHPVHIGLRGLTHFFIRIVAAARAANVGEHDISISVRSPGRHARGDRKRLYEERGFSRAEAQYIEDRTKSRAHRKSGYAREDYGPFLYAQVSVSLIKVWEGLLERYKYPFPSQVSLKVWAELLKLSQRLKKPPQFIDTMLAYLGTAEIDQTFNEIFDISEDTLGKYQEIVERAKTFEGVCSKLTAFAIAEHGSTRTDIDTILDQHRDVNGERILTYEDLKYMSYEKEYPEFLAALYQLIPPAMRHEDNALSLFQDLRLRANDLGKYTKYFECIDPSDVHFGTGLFFLLVAGVSIETIRVYQEAGVKRYDDIRMLYGKTGASSVPVGWILKHGEAFRALSCTYEEIAGIYYLSEHGESLERIHSLLTVSHQELQVYVHHLLASLPEFLWNAISIKDRNEKKTSTVFAQVLQDTRNSFVAIIAHLERNDMDFISKCMSSRNESFLEGEGTARERKLVRKYGAVFLEEHKNVDPFDALEILNLCKVSPARFEKYAEIRGTMRVVHAFEIDRIVACERVLGVLPEKVARMLDTYNIFHLTRYPLNLLKHLIKTANNELEPREVRKPKLLVVFPRDDWNTAFYGKGDILCRFMRTHDLAVYEIADVSRDFARVVQEERSRGRRSRVCMLGAHGNPKGLAFAHGKNVIEDLNAHSMRFVHPISEVLEGKADVILDSCSSAQERKDGLRNIATRLREAIPGARVFGADNATRLMNVNVGNDGRVTEVEFSDAKTVSMP